MIGKGIVFTVGLMCCSLIGCGQGSEEPSREVVVYSSADSYVARPIFDAFTEQTGITVRYLGDTEATKTVGLVEKLRAEKNNPRADVFWSSDAYQLAALALEGVFGTIDGEILASWPESHQSPDGRWVAFADRVRVLVYNTQQMDESEVPTTLDDLTGDGWPARTVMAQPQFGTTRAHMGALVAIKGEGGAREWLETMEAGEMRLVDSNSTVVRDVASGRADIGLTDTDDVWAGQRNGYPVGVVYLDHEVTNPGVDVEGGAMVIANAAAPVAGGPNRDEAMAFIDFLISEKAERMIAETDSHNVPVRPGLAEAYPEYRIPDPPGAMVLPINLVVESIGLAMRLCEEIL